MSETVLVPPTRSGGKCFHHPAPDDPARPICGSDALAKTDWRALPPDHPKLTFRRECQVCASRREDES